MWMLKGNTYFPYWLGGLGAGIINVIFLVLTDRPLGITPFYNFLGDRGREVFSQISIISFVEDQVSGAIFVNSVTILGLGVIIGSLLSVMLSGTFRLQKNLTVPRVLRSLLGGMLMGYGAYIARGCNIGAMVGGIASFSFHGWVFTFFMVLGVYIGGRLFKLFA